MVPKVNAPDFPQDLDWFNTTESLTLEKLRGKIVLLDFWTYCCINCIHVLPDLKKLEQKYRDELVVVGVHCAKFPNERNAKNIREAISRYEIEHPVVNDHTFTVWKSYNVRAWPTFVLIDPEGKMVGAVSGEGNWDFLNEAIGALAKECKAKGTLKTGILPQLKPETSVEKNILSYPGKIIVDASGQKLFISDSNHNRILLADSNGHVMETIGSGHIGVNDGKFSEATFNHPQGMCLVDENLFVADTENHAIRKIDLKNKTVTTVAGTGKQAAPFATPGDPMTTHLNSPWDLAAFENKIFIAMAGSHQIWMYDLDENQIGPFAGTGQESRVDGPLASSCFAQPSGLAIDGHKLYVADSETSAIRKIDLGTGEVTTLVGIALFDFGDEDGSGDQVRLQHPIGVHAYGGKLFIADTYNHKIKFLDPSTRTCMTVLGTGKPGRSTGNDPAFYEPCGLCVAQPYLYIADTNNHRILKMFLEDRVVSEVKVQLKSAQEISHS